MKWHRPEEKLTYRAGENWHGTKIISDRVSKQECCGTGVDARRNYNNYTHSDPGTVEGPESLVKKKLERKQRGWRNDMPMVSELILKVHIKSLICRNLYQCLDTVILSFFSVLVSQMQALYPPPSSFFLASPGSTWTSWRMRGRLVTTPVPLGSKSLPTRLSSTELFPLLC